MSCPGGRSSSSSLPVKSLSGSTSTIGRVADVLEALGGRDLDQHARGTVGARPHHAGIDRHVAGLQAVGDARPIRREAEIGSCDTVDDRRRGRRAGRRQEASARQSRAGTHANRHWASSSRFAATMPAPADSAPTLMRQRDDSRSDAIARSRVIPTCQRPVEGGAARLLRHRGRASSRLASLHLRMTAIDMHSPPAIRSLIPVNRRFGHSPDLRNRLGSACCRNLAVSAALAAAAPYE